MTKTCSRCGDEITSQGLAAHRAGRRCTVIAAIQRQSEQGFKPVPSQRGMTAALRAIGARTIEDYVSYSAGNQHRRASAIIGMYAEPIAITAAQMVLHEQHLATERRRRERDDRRTEKADRENAQFVAIVGGDVAWKYLNRHRDGSLRSYWNPMWQYRAGQPVSDGPPKKDHGSGIYVCRTRRDAHAHGYAHERVLVVGRADYTGCVDYGTKVAVREFTPVCVVIE